MFYREGYNGRKYYEECKELKNVVDQIAGGFFNPHDPQLFCKFMENLINFDRFKVLADFQSYMECQERVSETYMVRITVYFNVSFIYSNFC